TPGTIVCMRAGRAVPGTRRNNGTVKNQTGSGLMWVGRRGDKEECADTLRPSAQRVLGRSLRRLIMRG
ncbi:hypothetical protein KJR85_28090, partial [Klebsiella pneumoniae]